MPGPWMAGFLMAPSTEDQIGSVQMQTLVTGATGLIGRALLGRLDSAVVLTREPERAKHAFPAVEAHAWSPEAGPPPAGAFDGVDVVFNLAGEPVAEGRWTDDKKRRIRDSRVLGTRNLVAGLAALEKRPRVLVSASAVGYYGDRGDEELAENSAAGSGFLADICRDWEAATAPAEAAGIRVVHMRTGIVLSAKGGALKKQLPLFKLGLGGKFGDGRQWQSWISMPDQVGAISHLLTADVSGPVNLTAPTPVTNAEFTAALAEAVHRPAFVPIPSFGPKLLLGGELAESLLFTGQRVLPAALLAAGYRFEHPTIDAALRALLSKSAAA